MRYPPSSRRVRSQLVIALRGFLLLACLAACTPSTPGQPSSPGGAAGAAPPAQVASPVPNAPADQDWPTYHADSARRGVGPDTPVAGTLQPAWTSDLDGQVYAEPLVASGLVVAVTEHDTVYALDVATGAVRWSQHLGEPVPLAELPCGNIDPSGLTSTPVVDPQTGTVFVAGRFEPIHHELVALDLATGTVRFRRTVDPSDADPSFLQQRGALALANGRVYVPFGGNIGDCGPYRGWVVGVAADGSGDLLTYGVPTEREGAIWAPSGIAVDTDGSLLVATGNAASTTEFDMANAVIRLSPDLQALDFWAPANWAALSRSDTDIGSIGPSLLDDDQTFQSGKSGVGYLLRASDLGGIGGELFSASVCGGAYGGTAYATPLLVVPCVDGLAALQVESGSFTAAWRTAGPFLEAPIVAYGWVWSVARGTAELWQIDPADGTVHERYPLGDDVKAHFLTPTASSGLLLVPAGSRIVALSVG